MVFFMKTSGPSSEEPEIVFEETELLTPPSNNEMVCEPYLKSEIFKEIANLEFFWKKMKKGGGIDSEWASVEDTSNVIFCRWKFRVFHGEACNRGLKIALIFDRHLKIVFDAHVSITDSEAYLYDRVVSARANEALELRRYKFDFANAVRQNCLKIRIKLMIATDVALPFVFAYQQKLGRITENPAAMTEGIRSLFADKLHKDFMLRVQFDKIFVHKVILVARSPFFAAALAVKKSPKELEMKDIKLEVLRAVVFYMYTDEVPSLTDLTYELINAAKTFQMVDLYNKCMNQVLEVVSVDNALELRLIAEEYNCVELKKVLNHFITECPTSLFNINDTEKWMERHPSVIKNLTRAHVVYGYFLQFLSLCSWKSVMIIAGVMLLYKLMKKSEIFAFAS